MKTPKQTKPDNEERLDDFIKKRIHQLPKDTPPAIKKKLLNDAKFFSEHGIKTEPLPKALDRIKAEPKKSIKAYPNYDNHLYIQPERDTKKWVEAVRELYYLIHKGEDGIKALQKITAGMGVMEKLDFQSWLRFYQEGGHQKYKTAQAQPPAQINYWEDANRAGYFVPIFPERPQAAPNQSPNQDIDNARDRSSHPDLNEDSKRETIEKQRNKIVGRLDSAEKLLRSPEGQLFADKEFEMLLEIIYQLKKKIHLVNKISTNTRLYQDMIVREANILTKRGFVAAAKVLHTVAQEIPNPIEAKGPLENSGVPGSIPGEGPGMAPEGINPNDTFPPTDPNASASPVAAPPGIAAGKNPGQPGDADVAPPPFQLSDGMKEFLEGLDDGNDSFVGDEGLEVQDTEDDELMTTAQTAEEIKPLPSGGLEVSEEQVSPDHAPSKDFDSLLDTAFSGLTVQDVVTKLEEVAKIFKVREISNRLAFVDLMLNQLGLASLFPSMGEAINKSLESNQYISTRVDDILSRLRGTLKTKNVDLTEQEAPPQNPGAQQAKQQLTEENQQEKDRKKLRKDQENQELNPGKMTPEIDVAQEMAPQSPAPKAPPPLPTAPTP